MNKIYILLFGLFALYSCDPMADTYDELDALKSPITKQFEYTLADADYKSVTDAALKTAKTKEDSTNAKKINTRKYFTEQLSAKQYMPAFLAVKYPALGEKSVAKITYAFDSTEKDSVSQFVLTSEGWIFDPSVNYMMGKTDYQIIVDTLIARGWTAYYDGKNKNAEYYYGANAWYGQFDIAISSRMGKDPDGKLFIKDGDKVNEYEAEKIIGQQVQAGILIFLKSKFPDAQPKQDGADMYYNISYIARTSENIPMIVKYQCIAPGEFKQIGEASKVK